MQTTDAAMPIGRQDAVGNVQLQRGEQSTANCITMLQLSAVTRALKAMLLGEWSACVSQREYDKRQDER